MTLVNPLSLYHSLRLQCNFAPKITRRFVHSERPIYVLSTCIIEQYKVLQLKVQLLKAFQKGLWIITTMRDVLCTLYCSWLIPRKTFFLLIVLHAIICRVCNYALYNGKYQALHFVNLSSGVLWKIAKLAFCGFLMVCIDRHVWGREIEYLGDRRVTMYCKLPINLKYHQAR